jgi:2-polyprenyl-3-methyl-5-hydroxy-6-metoxy-1,4-benzoquinol methylase
MMKWQDHYWFKVPCVRARIEEIVRLAKGADTVLDAGCNDGFLSQALIEAGFTVTSVDINHEATAKAKEQFGIDVLVANVCDLPYPDNYFDLVVGGELLEHLENPGKGLSELFRVSKGRVILSLPIGKYWLGEESHRWCIESEIIEHDQGLVDALDKKLMVLEFRKR